MSASTPDPAGWRRTIESYGGLPVLAGLLVAVFVVAAVLFRGPPGFGGSESTAVQGSLGEPVALAETVHVEDGELGPNPPLPPAGGPHYAVPLRGGIYAEPVPDGNAIHSLEHGLVWMTYQPEAITDGDLEALVAVATEFQRDVILAPRLENSEPVIVVSWGRRLILDAADEAVLRDYVLAYVDQAPEPGLR